MPVTSSDFVYYGGFHLFSSTVFVSTSSGGSVASTWFYYGGFHVFSQSSISSTSTGGSTGNPSSTWQYYGGFHIFGNSTGSSTGSSTGPAVNLRKLISPTGFLRYNTIERL